MVHWFAWPGAGTLSRDQSYHGGTTVRTVVCVLAVSVAFAPRASLAQKLPGLGGVEFRFGVADPENADKGYTYALEFDGGYLWRPALRSYIGLEGFKSDVAVKVSGADVGGSIKGTGIEFGVRYDLIPERRFSPYGVAGLNFSNVSANGVDEPTTKDLLDGFHSAVALGGGLAWHLGTKHTWSVVGDLRYITGTNVGRTVVTAGMRWSPRGVGTYTPEPKSTG